MGGKQAVRIKQVVYTLSPFQQSVMSGLFKDIPSKLSKKISENWFDVLPFGVLPVVATLWYANDFKEKEKMHERF